MKRPSKRERDAVEKQATAKRGTADGEDKVEDKTQRPKGMGHAPRPKREG